MLSESDVVVQKLVEVFDAVGIPYMVGGSIASSSYGVPRLTHDVDFAVQMNGETDIATFVNALSVEFHVDEDLVREAITYRSSFNVIYLPTMTKAGIFISEDTVWRQENWRRRQLRGVGIGGTFTMALFASPEDTVLQKLLGTR